MKHSIVVSVEQLADGSHVGRLRNFGEDLFRMFGSGKDAIVDIDAVDRATDRIVVAVNRKGQFRNVLRKVEVQAERHFPDRIVTVSTEDSE